MKRSLQYAIVAFGAVALALQWSVVGERTVAALWNWYKFVGYGGAEPLSVGRHAQALFFCLTFACAAFLLVATRLRPESRCAKLATWEYRGLLSAAALWGVVLISPIVAPLRHWR